MAISAELMEDSVGVDCGLCCLVLFHIPFDFAACLVALKRASVLVSFGRFISRASVLQPMLLFLRYLAMSLMMLVASARVSALLRSSNGMSLVIGDRMTFSKAVSVSDLVVLMSLLSMKKFFVKLV